MDKFFKACTCKYKAIPYQQYFMYRNNSTYFISSADRNFFLNEIKK